MLFTREQVRDNVRNLQGKRVFFLGKNDCLTSEARDYLRAERIEILPASQARPERYSLIGGGYLEEKPEHMTHLDGSTLVPKTHPRIIFRGKMDTLEAELLLAIGMVPGMGGELGEILTFARKLLRSEVLGTPVEDVALLGLSEGELRQHSHFPQEHYGIPHFMPEATDGAEIAWLNRARCAAREAELAAAEAFSDQEGQMTRQDLLRAMNRMSSAIYLLMIRQKKLRCRKQDEGKEGNP